MKGGEIRKMESRHYDAEKSYVIPGWSSNGRGKVINTPALPRQKWYDGFDGFKFDGPKMGDSGGEIEMQIHGEKLNILDE